MLFRENLRVGYKDRRKEMNRPIVNKIQNLSQKLVCSDRAGLRIGPAEKLFGSLMRHRNDREYGSNNSDFQTRRIFFRKFWKRALKNLRLHSRKPKKFKEYLFEGVPNYLPARGANMSRAGPVYRYH
jgi:hypothetical protein